MLILIILLFLLIISVVCLQIVLFTDSADRMYFFFKTSCNNITSFVLCKDLSLGICIINDPIPFKTFMKCFNENAYYFLKRKYPENKKNEEKE